MDCPGTTFATVPVSGGFAVLIGRVLLSAVIVTGRGVTTSVRVTVEAGYVESPESETVTL